ncbi:MAG: DUF3800 domain-containing protein [Blastocatellia bacterium]
MSETFNIYCDESCHLENDGRRIMVLGAVECPFDKVREINSRLLEIKKRHGLKSTFKTKWVKVSPAQQQFYLDTVDYFFDDDDLHFRALIVPDKTKLRHEFFSYTHDDCYYRMYFELLKAFLHPESAYRIYLDIKDTRSATKVANLHNFLCDHVQDHNRQIIAWIQQVRSREVEVMQLADLLIGAISYVNRNLSTSSAKLALIGRIIERSHYDLTKSTLILENKINLEFWSAGERVP